MGRKRSIWMVLLLVSYSLTWCSAQPPDLASESSNRVVTFCSDCHSLPKPESFERDVWHSEVRKGFEFYARSGRTDLVPPTIEEVVRYFRTRAPHRMAFPASGPVDKVWQQKFQTDDVNWKDTVYIPSGISSLTWTPWKMSGSNRLIASDCRDGSLSLLQPSLSGTKREILFRAQNPARINPCDLNGDGLDDYIVSDLGSIYPYDHELGKVACLLADPKSKSLIPILLGENFGRIADAAVGDLAGSSMPDVVVAEFGHRETGSLVLLTNIAEAQGTLKFERKVLDNRPGTVRVMIRDFDGDGLNDILAMVTQESECIDLYVNRGDRFERRTIWSAEDISFGSVAMELVDLDKDGDIDVLFCNGDSFDNNFANASHGVQWLENRGDLRFVYHRLVDLVGAYSAKAADIDNDGDLDILAVANLPASVKPKTLLERETPSIVLLLNDREEYTPVVLSSSKPRFTTVEVGDFNADAKLDFVVGSFEFGNDPATPRLTFWWQK